MGTQRIKRVKSAVYKTDGRRRSNRQKVQRRRLMRTGADWTQLAADERARTGEASS